MYPETLTLLIIVVPTGPRSEGTETSDIFSFDPVS